jgi:hypothetical protein
MAGLTFEDINLVENGARYLGVIKGPNQDDYLRVRIGNRCIVKFHNKDLDGNILLDIDSLANIELSDKYVDTWHSPHILLNKVVEINIKRGLNATKMRTLGPNYLIHYFYDCLNKKDLNLKLFNFTSDDIANVKFCTCPRRLPDFNQLQYQIYLKSDEVVRVDFELVNSHSTFKQAALQDLTSVKHEYKENNTHQIVINNYIINLDGISNTDLYIHLQFMHLFWQHLNPFDVV